MSDNISFVEMDEPIDFGLRENADLGLGPPKQRRKDPPSPGNQFHSLANIGVGISTFLLQKILSHPCMVLRRQCQVNKNALRRHITPFTLVPVAFKLAGRQGFGTLWKGGSSVFIVHGLELAVTTAVADLCSLPKEVFLYTPIKQALQHLALKGISLALMTPFLCTSLVETVQSDIASEKPGVTDCLREGLYRIVRWGKPRTSRMMPIGLLLGPTIVHGIMSYSVSTTTHSVAIWYLRLRLQRTGPITQTDKLLIEVLASFVGNLMSDLLLYPFETVLHRLYLQGTRCIIDNLDTGLSVIPVVTNYEGPFHCFHSIVQEEGASGLYRGFGSVVLQYCLQALILKGASMLLDGLRQFVYPEPPVTPKKQSEPAGPQPGTFY